MCTMLQLSFATSFTMLLASDPIHHTPSSPQPQRAIIVGVACEMTHMAVWTEECTMSAPKLPTATAILPSSDLLKQMPSNVPTVRATITGLTLETDHDPVWAVQCTTFAAICLTPIAMLRKSDPVQRAAAGVQPKKSRNAFVSVGHFHDAASTTPCVMLTTQPGMLTIMRVVNDPTQNMLSRVKLTRFRNAAAVAEMIEYAKSSASSINPM
mmetsp:Transcript_49763/g.117962  ORF Transcript_49763/g.117962 Transcript_49763/m.117962 type:complete len:211 (-) Transcript_49763:611-1243(-)